MCQQAFIANRGILVKASGGEMKKPILPWGNQEGRFDSKDVPWEDSDFTPHYRNDSNDHQPSMMPGEREWIAIREGCEMPRDFEDVFVMSGGKQIIAWRQSDDPNWYEAYSDSNEPLGENVTYWQSFPAPPKEGTR